MKKKIKIYLKKKKKKDFDPQQIKYYYKIKYI